MPDKQVGEQLMRFGDDLSHHVRYAVMKNPVVLIQLHLVGGETQASPCK